MSDAPLPPLLRDKDYAAPSAFTPDSLLREAQRQKGAERVAVPEVCLLDPDGDIVRALRAEGRARRHDGWVCYHTDMWVFDLEGHQIGVVGCAVGASFAVLVAEEMFASGCRLLISVTSSGQITPQGALVAHLNTVNWPTLIIGVLATGFLFWVRRGLKPLLLRAGLRPRMADLLAKTGPVAAVAVSTIAVWLFGLDGRGVAIVGAVPQGLPPLTLPDLSPDLVSALVLSAALISIIGFVESVSVAQTLAAKKRQRIDPNQELIGLGAANLGAAFTGGYPVTGGFARSVVNFDAGAFTAVGLAIAALALTPLIFFLPKAVLAGTIIVAVLSLVDFSILRKSWAYSYADFAAVLATILLTLGLGVSAGVILSIALHLYKTSRPHVAEVGLVPGTQHFRNILRHRVKTNPAVLTLRVDQSLYFANARFLEDMIQGRVVEDCPIRHVVLMCSAVNEIDFSALESLESINERLKAAGITLHLSEVKGPVIDGLKRSHFLNQMDGKVFLSQYDA